MSTATEPTPKRLVRGFSVRFLGPFEMTVNGWNRTTARADEKWPYLLLLLIRQPGLSRAEYGERIYGENPGHDTVYRAFERLEARLGPEGGRLHWRDRNASPWFEVEGADVDIVEIDAALREHSPDSFRAAVARSRGPLFEGQQTFPKALDWVRVLREQVERDLVEKLQRLRDETGLDRTTQLEIVKAARERVAADEHREALDSLTYDLWVLGDAASGGLPDPPAAGKAARAGALPSPLGWKRAAMVVGWMLAGGLLVIAHVSLSSMSKEPAPAVEISRLDRSALQSESRKPVHSGPSASKPLPGADGSLALAEIGRQPSLRAEPPPGVPALAAATTPAVADKSPPRIDSVSFDPPISYGVQRVCIRVRASDPGSGVEHVVVYASTAPDGTGNGSRVKVGDFFHATSGSVTWDISDSDQFPDGRHRIEIEAFDYSGNWLGPGQSMHYYLIDHSIR